MKPIRISINEEHDGVTDAQYRSAHEKLIEICDEDIIRSRQSCYA
jgi:hypothetical protein